MFSLFGHKHHTYTWNWVLTIPSLHYILFRTKFVSYLLEGFLLSEYSVFFILIQNRLWRKQTNKPVKQSEARLMARIQRVGPTKESKSQRACDELAEFKGARARRKREKWWRSITDTGTTRSSISPADSVQSVGQHLLLYWTRRVKVDGGDL